MISIVTHQYKNNTISQVAFIGEDHRDRAYDYVYKNKMGELEIGLPSYVVDCARDVSMIKRLDNGDILTIPEVDYLWSKYKTYLKRDFIINSEVIVIQDKV